MYPFSLWAKCCLCPLSFIKVILNFVGFAVFWLPPSCGERMSLSITAMLAALASEIVVAEKLPAAAEWTWFAIFSMISLMFAFISLLECVLVLAFYYKCDEDLGKLANARCRDNFCRVMQEYGIIGL